MSMSEEGLKLRTREKKQARRRPKAKLFPDSKPSPRKQARPYHYNPADRD